MKDGRSNKIVLDTIKNSLLNSALNISNSIYNNFNACLSRNIILYNKIALDDFNNLEMGLGLKAEEDIEQGQEILNIPIISGLNGLEMIDIKNDENLKVLKSLMNRIAGLYSKKSEEYYDNKSKNEKIDTFRYEKMLQTQSLVWQAMVNLSNNEAYNHELVNSFPNELTNLICYRQPEIMEMSSLSMQFYYSETISSYKYIYDIIKKEGIFEVSEEMFIWAYANILSRKQSITDNFSKDDSFPIELISPIIEYINHSSTNENVIVEPDYDMESNNSILRLYSTKNIKKNDQLFLDYSKNEEFNNRQLINRYGFFDKENKIKNIELPFISEEIFEILGLNEDKIFKDFLISLNNDNQKNFRFEILRKEKLLNFNEDLFKMKIHDNKFEMDLLRFLRIIFLKEDQCDTEEKKKQILSHNFKEKYSKENEKNVILFLLKFLNKYYDAVKEKEYEKLISELGVIQSREKFMIKNIYLLELEEKNLLQKNLKFLENKINKLI